MAAITSGGAVL